MRWTCGTLQNCLMGHAGLLVFTAFSIAVAHKIGKSFLQFLFLCLLKFGLRNRIDYILKSASSCGPV